MAVYRLFTRCFLLLLISAMVAGNVRAHAEMPVDAAVKRLAIIETFAFGGVGYAGRTSEGEVNFRTILSEPRDRALALYEKLYATGNLQAKCYALAGIRALSPARFRDLYHSIRTSKEDVRTMRGCIVSSERLSHIADEIDRGDYDSWLKVKRFPST